MQKGDLSNEVIPRILLVFENAVGWLPDANIKAHAKARAKQHWEDAVACWDLNELMLRKIWDVTFRKSITVEVVTFLGAGFADCLAARLDEEDVPVHRVWATTPAQLARKITFMPDVAKIYDPDEAHVFTYGAKGCVLTDVHQLGE
jgi:hypothetical protein